MVLHFLASKIGSMSGWINLSFQVLMPFGFMVNLCAHFGIYGHTRIVLSSRTNLQTLWKLYRNKNVNINGSLVLSRIQHTNSLSAPLAAHLSTSMSTYHLWMFTIQTLDYCSLKLRRQKRPVGMVHVPFFVIQQKYISSFSGVMKPPIKSMLSFLSYVKHFSK